jgi:hypothetical protein
MTQVVDIANRMMQRLGTRTTMTAAQLTGTQANGVVGLTNEAAQFNLMYAETRDALLRMAPWNCAMKTANMTYITSSPGTPENTSAATTLWQPGQPAPPYSYEYQYPVDCLNPRWIIPSTQTGFADAIPITTAVTGGASSYWWGQPIKFKVQIDQFYPVTGATVASTGPDNAVGDIITLAAGPTTNPPIGAPAQLSVATVDGAGNILTVTVVNQINGETTIEGGSYFAPQANPVAQGTSTGAGTGATFNLTFGPQGDQRVILTNQEFATLSYTRQVIDPNVFDPSFRDALYDVGAAELVMALKGDRNFANQLVSRANDKIRLARGTDGNEGLTINDVTPDWIRTRGVNFTDGLYSGPYQGYDWGSFFPMY